MIQAIGMLCSRFVLSCTASGWRWQLHPNSLRNQHVRAVKLAQKGLVQIVNLDVPRPGPDEVLLRVTNCGICGSDLHAYRGAWGGNSFPGHELCATVEVAGPDVRGLSPGQRVVAECFAHCGKCAACTRGDYNLCQAQRYFPGRPAGGMAEEVVYPAGSLFAVPEAFSDAQAAMVEPLAVAWRAVARAEVSGGESIAVIGAGTIGLLCAWVCAARGASHVFLLAKHPHQAQKARELGVAEPILPQDGNPQEIIAGRAGGVDAAIDCAAAGTSLSVALAIVRKGGRVVEAGGVTRPLLVALGPLTDGELRVTGSSCYGMTDGRPDFEWAMELIASGKVSPERLITHMFPLAEAAKAFQTAADKTTGAIKVMVAVGD